MKDALKALRDAESRLEEMPRANCDQLLKGIGYAQ